MDGRLNGSLFTGTALGIIQPCRNVGGKFNLGWTGFKDLKELSKLSCWSEQTKRIEISIIFACFEDKLTHQSIKNRSGEARLFCDAQKPLLRKEETLVSIFLPRFFERKTNTKVYLTQIDT